MQAFRSSMPLRAALAGVVLVALVLMQSLGLLHRTVHGGLPAAKAVPVAAGTSTASAAHWTVAAFAGHDHEGCLLFDQLSHADALCGVPVIAVLEAHPQAPDKVHRSWHLAQQSAGFLARGPPALS